MTLFMLFANATVFDAIHEMSSRIPSLPALNTVVACAAAWALIQLVRISRRRCTPALRGPASPSFAFGVEKVLLETNNPAPTYESWAQTYGAVYQIPSTLGNRRVMLHDPKAIAHFHAKDTWTYVRTRLAKQGLEYTFGRGVLWADGETHKRQRKNMSPAFSIAAIRKLTPIFYDSAYKTKGAWNALIESGGGDSAIIDVQNWMNHISLDSIGLAGFSHDFGALDGKHASVTEIFDAFASSSPPNAISMALVVLAQVFPLLIRIPTPRNKLLWKLTHAMEEISNTLLAKTRRELEMGVVDEKGEKSVIGLLIKGESAESGFHLSKDEVLSQMKFLLLGGYETTSFSLTWALIELSRNPEIQTKLRAELLQHDLDPTYEQLLNGLPYLDAVVHEILRLHVPIPENTRVAAEDDVIPLSEPVHTKSGELIESLYVAKGTLITAPLASVNCSTMIWGEDAKVFKPNRWLEDDQGQNGIPAKARQVQGHRHLLTFSDGPRICVGKIFGMTEFKAVLSVLIKNFVFELRDGEETKFEMARGLVIRPRVVGEEGCKVPLRVKAYVG